MSQKMLVSRGSRVDLGINPVMMESKPAKADPSVAFGSTEGILGCCDFLVCVRLWFF